MINTEVRDLKQKLKIQTFENRLLAKTLKAIMAESAAPRPSENGAASVPRSVRPTHQQTEIDTRKGKIEVDSGIAPLVFALNELPEIVTCSSCESSSDDGRATVSFEWECGYQASYIASLFDALQRRILRTPTLAAELTMYWTVPPDLFPCCALNCEPDDVEDISASILKFCLSRRPTQKAAILKRLKANFP
jgi:hypothetical protein